MNVHYVRESDSSMKAIVQRKYGSPDDLELMDIDIRWSRTMRF
jgi:hypothetical protein